LFALQVQGQWGDAAKAVRTKESLRYDSLIRGEEPVTEEAPKNSLEAWAAIDSRTSAGILPFFLQGAGSLDEVLTKESAVTADTQTEGRLAAEITKTRFGSLHFSFERTGKNWTLRAIERRRVVTENSWLPSVVREEVGSWMPLKEAPKGAFALDSAVLCSPAMGSVHIVRMMLRTGS
jgi:hypothetical protein